MPNQPYQDTLHFLNAHIHTLDHRPVEHSCRHIPSTAFLLEAGKTLQDDAFTVCQTISDIREIITRVTIKHRRFSLLLIKSKQLIMLLNELVEKV
jgi:hypothetical protein